ncbi:MAG: Hpt domain-containing protein [Pyrinomonadaceae bacterium]
MSGKSMTDSVNDAVDMTVLSGLEGAQVDGEPDLIVELIDLYLEDTPRRLAAMSALLEQRDALSLRRAAHGLKGSSATLGAARTARLCEAVEEMSQDGSLAAVATLLAGLEQEFAHVRQSFLNERRKRTNKELAQTCLPCATQLLTGT